ncbi:hypothetical protein ACFPER_02140 [Agromyces aurantiacus]|uniref:Uncharacterized protein n=1 Tax=Agromyces aurantiacus TaxID=165814 RepID=A0ABV9R5I0_9MICO|nr:hypothetical protein [Agromyces aurantiacus]MBM7505887.1 hypothetical protein [Agromyces aurantiacus]
MNLEAGYIAQTLHLEDEAAALRLNEHRRIAAERRAEVPGAARRAGLLGRFGTRMSQPGGGAASARPAH